MFVTGRECRSQFKDEFFSAVQSSDVLKHTPSSALETSGPYSCESLGLATDQDIEQYLVTA